MKTKQAVSPAKSFDVTDLTNLLKTAGLVGVSAILTFLGSNLASIDFGQWTLLVVPALSAVIDFVLKWLDDNTDVDADK